jgi:hypothetical protein
MECYEALESSLGELQLWFRPHFNRRLERRVVSVQSPKSPTRDNFGTPLWESREKVPFECGSHGETQKDSHRCRLVTEKSGFERNAKPYTAYRVVFCKMAYAVMDMCNSNSFMKHDVSVSTTANCSQRR